MFEAQADKCRVMLSSTPRANGKIVQAFSTASSISMCYMPANITKITTGFLYKNRHKALQASQRRQCLAGCQQKQAKAGRGKGSLALPSLHWPLSLLAGNRVGFPLTLWKGDNLQKYDFLYKVKGLDTGRG